MCIRDRSADGVHELGAHALLAAGAANLLRRAFPQPGPHGNQNRAAPLELSLIHISEPTRLALI
eukprot:6972919-Alexandrium_andersonii.AAC.1